MTRANERRGTLRSIAVQAVLGMVGFVFLAVVGTSWYLTAPLESPRPAIVGRGVLPTDGRSDDSPPQPPEGTPSSPVAEKAESHAPSWPEDTLEGVPAKKLLLASLEAVERWFSHVQSYTLTFRKQERIKGRLLPEQTYILKVRQHPFAIYMKCLEPAKGRELIYAEGHYDNHVIGHPTGLSRLLIPRLKIPPDHPLILAESRYPMNQAGLLNMLRKMIRVRRMDLVEHATVTILDRTRTPDGKQWLRSRHTHPTYLPERPFAETQILYDPETRLPLRFTGFDFPEAGKKEPPLGERYSYDDLNLDVSFTARDFDPANPDYAFHRL